MMIMTVFNWIVNLKKTILKKKCAKKWSKYSPKKDVKDYKKIFGLSLPLSCLFFPRGRIYLGGGENYLPPSLVYFAPGAEFIQEGGRGRKLSEFPLGVELHPHRIAPIF